MPNLPRLGGDIKQPPPRTLQVPGKCQICPRCLLQEVAGKDLQGQGEKTAGVNPYQRSLVRDLQGKDSPQL